MFSPGWVLSACRAEKILMCLLHLGAVKRQKQNLRAPFIVNKQLLADTLLFVFSLRLPQTSTTAIVSVTIIAMQRNKGCEKEWMKMGNIYSYLF